MPGSHLLEQVARKFVNVQELIYLKLIGRCFAAYYSKPQQ